jgi:predicted transcriptional regulator
MAEEPPPRVAPDQVAEIVSSYVRHHQIAVDQLAGLIVEVHRGRAGLGRATPAQEPPKPAIPIRRSVQQDYVVCLECGFRAQMLRRHLRIAHGLEAADYRTRWQLPHDYPVTAPSYSARRSTFAKAIGLGRHTAAERAPPPTESAPAAEQPASASGASRQETRRGGRRLRRRLQVT